MICSDMRSEAGSVYIYLVDAGGRRPHANPKPSQSHSPQSVVPNYRKQWTHSLCISCCAELDGANRKSFGLEPPLAENDLPDLPFRGSQNKRHFRY